MSEEGSRRHLGVLEEEKDLGVKFDPSLTFSKHAAMVANKAKRTVGTGNKITKREWKPPIDFYTK